MSSFAPLAVVSLVCFSTLASAADARLKPRFDSRGHRDLAQEYEVVRRIALRDPKVQDAYAKANDRLEQKMVQLNPALRGYAHVHHPSLAEAPAATTPPVASGRPLAPKPAAAKPAAAPQRGAAKAAGASAVRPKIHLVKAGETLNSIAAKYGISPQYLQGTNRIRDARKVQVGQKLTIPDGR